ncbi:hypothetical protein [Anabaena sp. CS-542/02]|uniref:hypothetical protein n=1 Tax=Anabaena sp. CS-542/02 TaxID=3021719 RepID=UPI00232F66F4|nr:hypothetical protein [Anabaena sp. CS-542/02]MDB9446538.1 hypothetical protein [Anabaena sp. CS-542/02]
MVINDLDYCETTEDSIIGGLDAITDIQTYVAPGYAEITTAASAVGDESNTFTQAQSIVDDSGRTRISKAMGEAFATARDKNGFMLSYQKNIAILIRHNS